MKRLIALTLVLICVASFTSCTGEKKDDQSSKLPVSSVEIINIEEFASKGEIEGCEYALGTSPDKIKEDYHYGDDEYWGIGDTVSSKYNIDAVPLDVRETEDGRVRFTTSDSRYYYYTANADKGISYVAHFHDAYGLKVGIADTDTVKNAISAKPTYDDFVKSEELFFFFDRPDDVYSLKYTFGDYELAFYFINGKLSATCLSNRTLWNQTAFGG